MSFIFKQMLNNINTDIEALQLEDINIGIGGAALGEGISNLSTALGGEVARALGIESELRTDLNFELGRAKGIESDLRTDVDVLTTIVAGTASTSLTNTMQTEIDALKPLVGINNVFSMFKTTMDIPNSYNLYSNFDTTIKTSPYITFVNPNVNTGGTNTGCICQASGYYKIEYVFNALNLSYPDRVCWYSRIMINGNSLGQRSFIYTRANNNLYVQHGSAGSSIIQYCNQNDYIQLLTLVAKNSKYFNDDFIGLRGDIGTNMIITYLGN